jgi:hypothetical protein
LRFQLQQFILSKKFKLDFSLPVTRIANPFQEVKSPGQSKSKPGLFFIEYLKIKSQLLIKVWK